MMDNLGENFSRRVRKSAKSANRRTPSNEPKLSPFISGGRRDIYYQKETTNIIHTRSTYLKHLVKETLEDFSSLDIETKNPLDNIGGKFFVGECDFDDDFVKFPPNARVWKYPKTGRKGLDRFRRLVEFVIIAKRLFSRSYSRKLSHQENVLFFLDSQSEADDSGLLFDMTPFKAIGEKSFMKAIKSILNVPSQLRTEHDINSMTVMLQSLKKFSNYPKHVQRALCWKGWYAKFEKSKVIVREGGRADFYYLILSGRAVSRIVDGDGNEVIIHRRQTAEFLRQGDAIGEREILTNCERTTTIICKDFVEVLGVDREVFLDIFHSAGGNACMEYLRTIPEIQDFPLALLQTYHLSCSMHHYRRGAVIVKNSNEAEWIYIVKTGSCQVYKAIEKQEEPRAESKPRKTVAKKESSLTLPRIKSSKESRRKKSAENIVDRKELMLNSPTMARSNTILPVIKPGKSPLVSSNSSLDISRPTTGYKEKGTRRPQISARHSSKDRNSTLFYARLDIVTEREVFGLQSLIYKDSPCLSLVSNGAECILISKQFFRDQLDEVLINSLKCKVPPYPDQNQIQNAMDDCLLWDMYKEKVIQDSVK